MTWVLFGIMQVLTVLVGYMFFLDDMPFPSLLSFSFYRRPKDMPPFNSPFERFFKIILVGEAFVSCFMTFMTAGLLGENKHDAFLALSISVFLLFPTFVLAAVLVKRHDKKLDRKFGEFLAEIGCREKDGIATHRDLLYFTDNDPLKQFFDWLKCEIQRGKEERASKKREKLWRRILLARQKKACKKAGKPNKNAEADVSGDNGDGYSPLFRRGMRGV